MTIRGVGLVAEAVQVVCLLAIAALLVVMVWGVGVQELGWALPKLTMASPSSELHDFGRSLGANLVHRLGFTGGG